MLRPSALALLLTASAASADLIARFDEGAPKDRFTITNDGACALPTMTVVTRLGTGRRTVALPTMLTTNRPR